MAAIVNQVEYEKIINGSINIAAVYKGSVLIWEAVSKIWHDSQLWKNNEVWKY